MSIITLLVIVHLNLSVEYIHYYAVQCAQVVWFTSACFLGIQDIAFTKIELTFDTTNYYQESNKIKLKINMHSTEYERETKLQ